MTNSLRSDTTTPSSEALTSHVAGESEQLSSAVTRGVEPDQRPSEAVVTTSDTEAVQVVQLLALQVVTRNAARRACTFRTGETSRRQNLVTSEALYALIQTAQESSPLCRRVKELRLRDLKQLEFSPSTRNRRNPEHIGRPRGLRGVDSCAGLIVYTFHRKRPYVTDW
jgi:hypothetical protein